MRSPAVLNELIGDNDQGTIWRGWQVSVGVWSAFYAAGAAVTYTVGHGSPNAYNTVWLTGVAVMGFLRERGIGNGIVLTYAVLHAFLMFWVASHQPQGWKIAWSLAFLAAPLAGFALPRTVRRVARW